MATELDEGRREARRAIVEEHVRLENLHDVDGILQTFGQAPWYDDRPWGERRTGRDGVRSYYDELLSALPDLDNIVQKRHVADEAIVLELIIKGTLSAPWRGLPASGRKIEFPLVAVYEFDEADKLAGERIYYDLATVLKQLGLFHDPESALGKVTTAVTHPVTIGQALVHNLRRRS